MRSHVTTPMEDGSVPKEILYIINATICVNMKQNQNCVGNSRPDLGFLYWKWKPSECNLPRFDPNTFLQLISNKHVAFVGDSLSRNHIESLLSMLTTVTKPNGFSHQGSTRWVLPSHNATLSFYWSPFLVQVGKGFGSNGHDCVVPRALVFSSVFYWDDKVIGCQNNSVSNCTKDIGFYSPIRRILVNLLTNLKTALNSIIKKKVKKGNGIDVIVRTYSPSHFEGAWDKGVFVQRLSLIERGKDNLKEKMLRSEGFSLKKWKGLRQGPKNWERLRKAGNFKGFTLEVLDITKLALLRPDGHPGAFMNPFPFAKGVPKHVQNDCVHWCLPGPIDTWNEIFLEMMKNMAQKQLVRSEE
uniref:Uncharacterized protein n=1 Tax=Glycine max TaxID=3847 RepID=A0A0R0KXS9_SOYBN